MRLISSAVKPGRTCCRLARFFVSMARTYVSSTLRISARGFDALGVAGALGAGGAVDAVEVLGVAGALGAGVTGALGAGTTLAAFGGSGGNAFAKSSVAARKPAAASGKDVCA